MESGQPKREETILNLTEQTTKIIYDLREILDRHFKRNPEPESSKQEEVQFNNVLDEIINKQNKNIKLLMEIGNFMACEVVPKIS